MTDQSIKFLLQQYANNTISEENFLALIKYFKLSGNDEEILAAMDEIWRRLDDESAPDTEEVANSVYLQLAGQLKNKRAAKLTQLAPWYRYAAAAVALLVCAVSIYLFKSNRPESITQRFKNDVKPGFNHATLTLANGKVITLDSLNREEVIQAHGVEISKTSNGMLQYTYTAAGTDTSENTLSTPKGGQYQVVLSDGTHVWLNAASSLRFPIKFSQQQRTVKLSGEAYFEVAKNAKSPFSVIAGNQQIKVLGTHFDVSAYADETVKSTTLIEGKVNVITPAQNLIIAPGQQAVFENNKLRSKPADLEAVVAWKDGLFLYNQQSLESIMRQVARWYNVDVVFEDEVLKSQLFSGALSRFKNISELLEVLETTGSVHFKIEGRRVTAMQ